MSMIDAKSHDTARTIAMLEHHGSLVFIITASARNWMVQLSGTGEMTFSAY